MITKTKRVKIFAFIRLYFGYTLEQNQAKMAYDIAICITKFDHICQTRFAMRPKKCSLCAKIKKKLPEPVSGSCKTLLRLIVTYL